MKTFALFLVAAAFAATAYELARLVEVAQSVLPTIAQVQTVLPKVIKDADQIASAAQSIQNAVAPIEAAGKAFQNAQAGAKRATDDCEKHLGEVGCTTATGGVNKIIKALFP